MCTDFGVDVCFQFSWVDTWERSCWVVWPFQVELSEELPHSSARSASSAFPSAPHEGSHGSASSLTLVTCVSDSSRDPGRGADLLLIAFRASFPALVGHLCVFLAEPSAAWIFNKYLCRLACGLCLLVGGTQPMGPSCPGLWRGLCRVGWVRPALREGPLPQQPALH